LRVVKFESGMLALNRGCICGRIAPLPCCVSRLQNGQRQAAGEGILSSLGAIDSGRDYPEPTLTEIENETGGLTFNKYA
jgi:hypothetical protein